MDRRRDVARILLALTLALAAAPAARAEEPTTVMYSLAELGDDPALAKWVADTITELVVPGQVGTGSGAVSYFAPRKLLVVRHPLATHAEVEKFLAQVKKSLPGTVEKMPMPPMPPRVVLPAAYITPAALPVAPPAAAKPDAYPVPPVGNKAPKHLFHFIIRYEGDGVVDDNVVKAIAAQSGGSEEKEKSSPVTSVQYSTSPPSASPPTMSVPATLPAAVPPEPLPEPMLKPDVSNPGAVAPMSPVGTNSPPSKPMVGPQP
jgi:hypothetical protein